MESGSEEPSTPMSDNHSDAPRIGFLGVFGALTDDDPLRAALMVTDIRGTLSSCKLRRWFAQRGCTERSTETALLATPSAN